MVSEQPKIAYGKGFDNTVEGEYDRVLSSRMTNVDQNKRKDEKRAKEIQLMRQEMDKLLEFTSGKNTSERGMNQK